MSNLWYIKLTDRISDPVTIDELRQQAADGRLAPDAWVSRDCRHWMRPTQVEGLGFQAPDRINASSKAASTANLEEGDDSARESEPVNSTAGSSAGSPRATEDVAGEANKPIRLERVKAKVGDLVASAKCLTSKARDYTRSEEARARAEQLLDNAKEVSSRAKEHGVAAARWSKATVMATMPFWKRLTRELVAIVVATLQSTIRLFRYVSGLVWIPFLNRRARVEQLALGRRMYEVGVGDEILRGEISSLNDHIKSIGGGEGID